MGKIRLTITFGLLILWTASPVLACLPSQGMTEAEMACCKKMAGDCQMGAGQHPCCKTSMGHVAPVAKVEQPLSQVHPLLVAVPLTAMPQPAKTVDRTFTSQLGLPPPAPPGLTSVLRI